MIVCVILPMTSGAGARAVGLLEELVAIPSVTGAEGPLLDFLEERFRARGFSVETREVSPGRRNLFIRRGPATVVLTTHADTVPPFFPPRRGTGFSSRAERATPRGASPRRLWRSKTSRATGRRWVCSSSSEKSAAPTARSRPTASLAERGT